MPRSNSKEQKYISPHALSQRMKMSNLVHPSSYFTARKESATYCKGHLEGLTASLGTVVETPLNSLWKMNSDSMVIHP